MDFDIDAVLDQLEKTRKIDVRGLCQIVLYRI